VSFAGKKDLSHSTGKKSGFQSGTSSEETAYWTVARGGKQEARKKKREKLLRSFPEKGMIPYLYPADFARQQRGTIEEGRERNKNCLWRKREKRKSEPLALSEKTFCLTRGKARR